MVDPIVSKAVHGAIEQASQQGQPPRHVTADEQAQFENALNRPEDAADGNSMQPDHQEQVSRIEGRETEPQAVDPGQDSFGDALVKKIHEVQETYQAQSQKVETELTHGAADGTLSPEQLMKAQFEMMKMGLQTEFVTKGADKASTDVQTLMNRSN